MTVMDSLGRVSSCLSLWISPRAKRADSPYGLEKIDKQRNMRKSKVGIDYNDDMDELVGDLSVDLPRKILENEERDCSLWGGLPDDVVDRILSFLPIPLLLQYRLVCKRWKSLITSPNFLKLQASAPHSGPYFFVFESHRPESCRIYNPRLKKWYPVPPVTVFKGASILSMVSDGGLFCIVMRTSWYEGKTSIRLWNPATHCTWELPETRISSQSPNWIPSSVVLVVDKEKNSYKVIVAGSKGCPHESTRRVTEVFDSVSKQWETTGELPWSCIEFGYPSYAICGKKIYCIATHLGDIDLVAYDLEQKKWTVIPLQMPNLRGTQVLLYERRGILVLAQQASRPTVFPEIYTWEPGLNPAKEWTLVNVDLPDVPHRHFQLQQDLQLAWGGKGDLILLVSSRWKRALLYDMSQNSWSLTPYGKFLGLDHAGMMVGPFDFSLQLV